MSGFDLIIIAICLVSMAVGIFRGFIKESLSLISWILAIWLGITFCVEAGEFIHQYVRIPAPEFRKWAGFAAVFIGTLFLFAIIAYVINKLVVRGPIKGVDRVLGIGFGAMRGAALVVVLMLIAKAFGQDNAQWWGNSTLLPKFVPVMEFVEELLPESLRADEEDGAADSIQEQITEKAVEKLLQDTEN